MPYSKSKADNGYGQTHSSGLAKKHRNTEKSKVNRNADREEDIKEAHLPAQILDPFREHRQRKWATTSQTDDKYKGLPTDTFLRGAWLRPDPYDTEASMKLKMINANSGATPFGLAQLSDKDMKWLMYKKDQEALMKKRQLASYLIDPTDPTTQKHAEAVIPELRTVPEEKFIEEQSMQLALRAILRNGEIGGEEDNDLIAYIIRDDVELPTTPLWDPFGAILKDEKISKIIQDNEAKGQGIFNPRSWHVNAKTETDAVKLQRAIKRAILRRVYPGFRKEEDAVLNSFIASWSPVSNTWNVTEPTVPDMLQFAQGKGFRTYDEALAGSISANASSSSSSANAGS